MTRTVTEQKKAIRELLFSLRLRGIFLFFFITKNPMRASITAVDIGQGDSIFLQDKFNKENILIDTGGQLALPQKNWQKAQTQSNADKTLIPYLESMGVASY